MIPNHYPNKSLATGNSSFIDNEKITWSNIFNKDIDKSVIFSGNHFNLASVIQETKQWRDEVIKDKISFVDPEIGHMAKAAKEVNITFSYLHVISDNLSKDYKHDLSNERHSDVMANREYLFKQMHNSLAKVFYN